MTCYYAIFIFPQDIDRNQIISSLNGKKFFLVDVIAHILHHLKNQLVSALKDDCKKVKTSDINWLITVPAFWSNKAKEMMREAGHMVSPNSKFKFVIPRKNLTWPLRLVNFCFTLRTLSK